MNPFYNSLNNVVTTLIANYSAGSGVFVLPSGAGVLFGNVFPIRVTAVSPSTRGKDNEINTIYSISGVNGDSLIGVQAIEGTVDREWPIGTVLEMRVTAGAILDIQDQLVYSNPNFTAVDVGGIPAGSNFTNISNEELWNALLYPYQEPNFLSFLISGQVTSLEVGNPIPAGDIPFIWATSNPENVSTNSISVTDATNQNILFQNVANSGNHTYSLGSPIVLNVPGSHTWRIDGLNTNNVNFNLFYIINWLWKVYSGTSNSTVLNAAGIQNLNEFSGLASTADRSYFFPGGGYKYVCFPDSFATPTNWIDAANGLNVALARDTDDAAYNRIDSSGNYYDLVSVTNDFGAITNYRVYRTENILGGVLNLVVSG